MSDIVVKGRLIEPTLVELQEPLLGTRDEVEVLVRAQPIATDSEQGLEAHLLRLLERPPRNRTREDIEAQNREERDSWDSDR